MSDVGGSELGRTDPARSRLLRTTPRWWLVVAGIGGALLSVVWALDGSAFLQDDWRLASRVEFLGAGEVLSSSDGSSGPLSDLYFGLTHGLLGDHPAAHVMVLALLNGVVAAAILSLVTHTFGRRTGVMATAVWVTLPNRGSTRLWATAAPAVLSLALVLVGMLLVVNGRRRLGGVVLAAGVLAHWGSAGVALVALAGWICSARKELGVLRQAVVPSVCVLAALVVTVVWSSKGGADAPAFSGGREALSAQFGSGVFGPLAWVGGGVMVAAIAVGLARLLVPNLRVQFSLLDGAVLTGAAALVAGLAPFLVSGYPFAVDGLLDRGNLVAGVGTALILGALLAWVSRLAGDAGLVAAALAVGYLAAFNSVDLRDYRGAVDDGAELLARLDADLPAIEAPVVVGPPLTDRRGVAQFAGEDLGAALRVLRDQPQIEVRIASSAQDFASAGERVRYDWTLRTILVGRR